MVKEEVIIKEGVNFKRIFLVAFFFILVILILLGIFYAGSIFGSSKSPGYTLINPVSSILKEMKTDSGGFDNNSLETEVVKRASLEFNESYLEYVLYALSVNKLHNPPFSEDTPKIMMAVESKVYWAEITEGKAHIVDVLENPDIKISITKEEIIRAMLSEDIGDFMKSSVANGKTKIELLAGKVVLATKGYLQMYKDITGEDLS